MVSYLLSPVRWRLWIQLLALPLSVMQQAGAPLCQRSLRYRFTDKLQMVYSRLQMCQSPRSCCCRWGIGSSHWCAQACSGQRSGTACRRTIRSRKCHPPLMCPKRCRRPHQRLRLRLRQPLHLWLYLHLHLPLHLLHSRHRPRKRRCPLQDLQLRRCPLPMLRYRCCHRLHTLHL